MAAHPPPGLQESSATESNPPDLELVLRRPMDMSYGFSISAALYDPLFEGELNALQRAMNPPPDVRESSATESNPNESFAGRTGSALAPDLELALRWPTDMSSGFSNSAARDEWLFKGDLNCLQRAHNSATGWFPDSFATAREIIFILVAVSGAALLVYLAVNNPTTVLKISAYLFTGAISVTLLLLLVGWTCGYSKMVSIGVCLIRLELLLMMILIFLAIKCTDQR